MASEDKPVVIPVTREEAAVARSRVETGVVSVRKAVRERIEVIDEPMLHDEVDIEHVPMNRQWVLREEVRLRRREVRTRHREEVVLREEQALVERRAPDVRGST